MPLLGIDPLSERISRLIDSATSFSRVRLLADRTRIVATMTRVNRDNDVADPAGTPPRPS